MSQQYMMSLTTCRPSWSPSYGHEILLGPIRIPPEHFLDPFFPFLFLIPLPEIATHGGTRDSALRRALIFATAIREDRVPILGSPSAPLQFRFTAWIKDLSLPFRWPEEGEGRGAPKTFPHLQGSTLCQSHEGIRRENFRGTAAGGRRKAPCACMPEVKQLC